MTKNNFMLQQAAMDLQLRTFSVVCVWNLFLGLRAAVWNDEFDVKKLPTDSDFFLSSPLHRTTSEDLTDLKAPKVTEDSRVIR